MMTSSSADQIVSRSQFVLGAALALLISIFGFGIPLTAYLCDGFYLVNEADLVMPKLPAAVIAASPWLPVLIAVLGTLALLVKERKLTARASLRWNLAAVLVAILVGGFVLIVCCILPMLTLIRATNGWQWW